MPCLTGRYGGSSRAKDGVVTDDFREVEGKDEWVEYRNGHELRLMVDDRLLRRVIAAKAREAESEAEQPKTRTVPAPLRVVKDSSKRVVA